jgi:pSer/pThr/pTyr-binding forkhead associated (FHA) protein
VRVEPDIGGDRDRDRDRSDAPRPRPSADPTHAATAFPQATPSAIVELVIHVPARGSRRVRLPAGDHLVGRGRAARIRVPDATVSRAHGRLTIRAGVLVYVDIGSRNGSRLNGAPIVEAALGVGDRIGIGGGTIEVHGVA